MGEIDDAPGTTTANAQASPLPFSLARAVLAVWSATPLDSCHSIIIPTSIQLGDCFLPFVTSTHCTTLYTSRNAPNFQLLIAHNTHNSRAITPITNSLLAQQPPHHERPIVKTASRGRNVYHKHPG